MLKQKILKKHPIRIQEYSTVEKNRMWYEQLSPLLHDLRELPYAVIKGEILSLFAYGEQGYRSSHDIDLLVSRKNLMRLNEICEKHEFQQIILDVNGMPRQMTREEKIMFKNSHQIVPYSKLLSDGSTLELDINCDFFWAEYQGARINIDYVLEQSIDLELYGCHLKTLPPLTAFIQMCLHHYREMNSIYIYKLKNPITVAMFQDVYMFYKNHFKDNITLLYEYTCEHCITPYIYYLLFHANELFEDDILPKHLKLFETPDGKYLLNCYGLTESERKTWNYDFFTRLNHRNLFELVKSDLNEDDIRKIELSLSIK